MKAAFPKGGVVAPGTPTVLPPVQGSEQAPRVVRARNVRQEGFKVVQGHVCGPREAAVALDHLLAARRAPPQDRLGEIGIYQKRQRVYPLLALPRVQLAYWPTRSSWSTLPRSWERYSSRAVEMVVASASLARRSVHSHSPP